ncbi:MAG: rubredoxin [Oscillospiraceae bacterium]
MKKYVCVICGFVYDEAEGIPSAGIAPGTLWEALPIDWACPICGAAKSDFVLQVDAEIPVAAAPTASEKSDMRELTAAELSAICSNLAKGCEKQYMAPQSALFTQLADYFKGKTSAEESKDTNALLALIQKDLNDGFVGSNNAAKAVPDRGAMRALVWSEKVTRMLNSILTRYEKDGDAYIENTNVYVCETCGFVYIGDTPPEICPVCKVPSRKLVKVDRR